LKRKLTREPTIQEVKNEEAEAGRHTDLRPVVPSAATPLAIQARINEARRLQQLRDEKYAQQQRDVVALVEDMKAIGVTEPYSNNGQLLLEWKNRPHKRVPKEKDKEDNEEAKADGDSSFGPYSPMATSELGVDEVNPEPDSDEAKKFEEAFKREKERKQPDRERMERNRSRNLALGLTKMSSFWFSQIDIIEGCWATEWQKAEKMTLYNSLAGVVTVILEALLGFLDENTFALPRSQ
jgi:hypothetical protein